LSGDDFDNPLLEPSDENRMKTVAIAIAVSFIVITGVVAVLVYTMQPDWGAEGAFGAGLFVGFWTAPLAGGVAGNGIHEHRMGHPEGSSHLEGAHH
jgi:hypothetical protein